MKHLNFCPKLVVISQKKKVLIEISHFILYQRLSYILLLTCCPGHSGTVGNPIVETLKHKVSEPTNIFACFQQCQNIAVAYGLLFFCFVQQQIVFSEIK